MQGNWSIAIGQSLVEYIGESEDAPDPLVSDPFFITMNKAVRASLILLQLIQAQQC